MKLNYKFIRYYNTFIIQNFKPIEIIQSVITYEIIDIQILSRYDPAKITNTAVTSINNNLSLKSDIRSFVIALIIFTK